MFLFLTALGWVDASDPDFAEVAAAIGRKAVAGFKVGRVVEAARAWGWL